MIYRVCFGQDNGIVACYDGTSDGTFGGVDPNVVINSDVNLEPLTVNPGATIHGTVDNLHTDQHVRIIAHSGTRTPDGGDDFSRAEDFNADGSGILDYSLTVPVGHAYIVQFQQDTIPDLFYHSGNTNGTRDWNTATEFVVDADVYGISVTLPAAGGIAGNVLSEGQPLEGIMVLVFAEMCGNNDSWLATARTDENGHYQIDGLPLVDVYVCACPGCDNRNFFDQWHDGDGGADDCNLGLPVRVSEGVVSGIDFSLAKGPRYLNWWDAAVYNGSLSVSFDLLPGFNPFLESAVVEGPDGFSYVFDLEADVFQWLNECSYVDEWSHDFAGPVNYGEYTLTLTFKNGATKTYTHELVQVSLTAVDSSSMNHTVNPDGSIDFAWTNPDPNQKYQVRIYQGR